jgi:hypothetical protein
MKWYEWGSVREQLATFGRAIQGVSPYKVTIEPNPHRCETGWCNFTRREIAVNPNLFPGLRPADQYRATKALLVHEAGHRRFTTPSKLGPVIHGVFNTLEDERIERLMTDHFAGLGHLLVLLSAAMLRDVPALDPKSDQPEEVLNYILRVRWAERAGVKVLPTLSARNAARWTKIEPLVRESWIAPTSAQVEGHARQIAAILQLREIPTWLLDLLSKLGGLEGERAEDDKPEEGHTDRKPESGTPREPAADPDFDGLPIPDDHPAGSGEQAVTPAPYLRLVAEVQPLVEELVAELAWTPKAAGFETAPRGRRFSVREWLRVPSAPFLVEEDALRQPPALAFRVLVDHSTSMNARGRMSAARLGAMLLHLVGARLGISHEIALTPNDLRIANLTSGERGLALIAGIKGAMEYEGIDVTLNSHAQELRASRADIKLALVIHDGYPDTPKALQILCQSLRGKVEVIGLGLGYDENMAEAMQKLFGSDRLILCQTPHELPKKLGTLLRVIYGK